MQTLFDFIALDIETTGFDFEQDEIIEIGACKYKNGKLVDSFSYFIKPKTKVPTYIKQLTHITDKQLQNGLGLAEALTKLKGYVDGYHLICHNTAFDIGFINKKLEMEAMQPLENPYFDTLELSRIYLPFTSNHKLGTIAEYFKVELNNAHRAIYDAEATAGIFLNLMKYIEKYIPMKLNYRLSEVAKLADLSTDLTYLLEKIINHQKKSVLLSKKEKKLSEPKTNFINHKPAKSKNYQVEAIFQESGNLQKNFANYEIRKGQIDMAQACLEALESSEYLLVEAGTGVGKSLAYLIPAIIYTEKNDEKVIVATKTKNLQEQLFFKDIPTVKKCLEVPFKAVLLKGRGNYICEKRWQEYLMSLDNIYSAYEAREFLKLIVWKEFTKTGDISENSSFNPRVNSILWKKLVAERYFCSGRKCPYHNKCFLMNIRKKAEDANLVIINHHLMLADMVSENSVLGKYNNIVIDEAHNLPHMAPKELGLSLRYTDFTTFFNMLYSKKHKFQSGILAKLKADNVKSGISKLKKEHLKSVSENIISFLEDNENKFAEFFKAIDDEVEEKGDYGKLRVKDIEDFPFITELLADMMETWQELSKKFVALLEIFSDIKHDNFPSYDDYEEKLEGITQQIYEKYDSLKSFYNPTMEDHAVWLSNFRTTNKNFPAGIISSAPLNIDKKFNELLYQNTDTIIWTSATIAIRDKFKYFADRMGLSLLEKGFVRELVVESPFNYKKQSKVIIASMLPSPKDRYFSSQSIKMLKNVIDIVQKGTMVLFTSYKELNKAYKALSEELYQKDILLLAQGKGMSRSAMIKEFKKTEKAVLLGTSSFWEGVDIPGESLSMLILQKIPFLVPSEPITESYLEKLKTEGKNSFMHYMLPNALLRYKQGFGRLIRHKTDRGLVLVLDNRVVKKRYGHYFKDIVPSQTVAPIKPIEILDFVGQWFKRF